MLEEEEGPSAAFVEAVNKKCGWNGCTTTLRHLTVLLQNTNLCMKTVRDCKEKITDKKEAQRETSRLCLLSGYSFLSFHFRIQFDQFDHHLYGFIHALSGNVLKWSVISMSTGSKVWTRQPHKA